MSRKKIFIHIGTYKTGTSSIQHFFAKNSKKLQSQGMLYLGAGLHPNLHKHLALFDYCHSSSYNLERKRNWNGVDLAEMAKREISSSSAHSILISEEELSFPDPEIPKKLAFFKELGDVTIVFCVRRQDKFLESLYLQFMKEPGRRLKKSFGEVLVDPEFSQRAKFDQIADGWSDVFGRENIQLLDFEILKKGDELISNFSKVVGIRLDFDFDDLRFNETISHEMAEIIRRFVVIYPRAKRGRLVRALRELKIAPAKEKYEPLQMTSIMPFYKESNERLRDLYGVDLTGYGTDDKNLSQSDRLIKECNFERRINRIFMQLVRKAHKNKDWDFA